MKYKQFTVKEEDGYVLLYGSNLLICKIDKHLATVKFTDNVSLDIYDLKDIRDYLKQFTP